MFLDFPHQPFRQAGVVLASLLSTTLMVALTALTFA
jgi:hypothetical protein